MNMVQSIFNKFYVNALVTLSQLIRVQPAARKAKLCEQRKAVALK